MRSSESTYAELKLQGLNDNPYSCLGLKKIDICVKGRLIVFRTFVKNMKENGRLNLRRRCRTRNI